MSCIMSPGLLYQVFCRIMCVILALNHQNRIEAHKDCDWQGGFYSPLLSQTVSLVIDIWIQSIRSQRYTNYNILISNIFYTTPKSQFLISFISYLPSREVAGGSRGFNLKLYFLYWFVWKSSFASRIPNSLLITLSFRTCTLFSIHYRDVFVKALSSCSLSIQTMGKNISKYE